MKRSSFITWDQLKVGSLIVFAILVMGIALYKLGQAVNLFSKRYELQAYLKDAGYLAATPNGNFGPATLAAVKAFQLANGVSATGFVGPATRAMIKLKSCPTTTTTPSPTAGAATAAGSGSTAAAGQTRPDVPDSAPNAPGR